MARGKLRIYLGAAPGVGKTFAMLDEAWRGHQRGKDVIVGLVVTHARPKTIAQIRDLEVISPKTMEYRGATFEEMDTDAVIARCPQIVLVDELAHTNVPGSKHEKRWQDVEEILDHGIDVISTVNIQHLESLNDVVNRITGVPQRETVPDALVRAADQIELVDMSPEALRRRMAHGNIYAPEKVDAALGNYFRVGNLAALRELALLWLADRVDNDLADYRERHGITDPWETRERVVVALTGAPGGDNLVRRAARMALRTKADLLGVHVRPDDGLSRPVSELLEKHKALLLELGGHYHQVAGADIPAALVSFAKAERATQLVMGTSRRSRWTELTRGSIINNVIRLASPLDVHVIDTGDAAAERGVHLSLPRVRFLPSHTPKRILVAFVIALIGLVGLTTLLVAERSSVTPGEGLLVYLILMVLVALVGGIVPAVATLVAASLLDDWYLVNPTGSLTVERGAELVYLLVFLAVGLAITGLVELASHRLDQVGRAEYEADALLSLADRLTRVVPAQAIVEQIRLVFGLDSVVMVAPDGRVDASAGAQGHPAGDDDGYTEKFELGDYTLVLVGPSLPAADRRLLGAFLAHLEAVVRMHRLQDEAKTAEELSQANDLRTALLAAVSHDLRTPLASIKASATSLLEGDVSWSEEETSEFLRTIDEETDRLNNLVGNLLDMSRLQTGALQLHLQVVGLDEVVPAALSGLHHTDQVVVDVPETLPAVSADAALLERALANLISNAVSNSDGKPVRVEAGRVLDQVHLRVVDQGPGIPQADREKVFLPFQRLGDGGHAGGVGLGLAVAKGFIEAMGGELTIDDTPGGGVTMVISLAARDLSSIGVG